MKITRDIEYIGVNDREIDLFEGQYVVENGMAYNSYLITDEKIAVMDSVDKRFSEEWQKNLENALKGKNPDYLVVQHMEPDHSANIVTFMKKYENATVVASKKAFDIMERFYGETFADRRIIVGEGDTLNLGKHELKFIAAPMVHWPEVIVTYDALDKVLFSADAFGKFGALDTDEDWACEARRYYFGIVGKYGVQVQNLLKKVKALDINTVCPLHGPVLSENLEYYFGLYDTWSSYGVETEGVLIAYTSVYGNTKEAAYLLSEELSKAGCEKVVLNDLARCDMAEAVEDAFRYGKIALATTTYNGDIFPFMKEFIDNLKERNYQNRLVGIIENGSWAPTAAKVIKNMLDGSKNVTFAETVVTVKSALDDEARDAIKKLAKEMI